MQPQKNIIECYNKTAKNYAATFINELENKHLDRILLQSFALENTGKGKLIDLGCGPGQTTKYVAECGLTDIVGIDVSPEMVSVAQQNNAHLHFETADMLQLKYPDSCFGSAIAFYSIVHFDLEQIKTAFKEIKRVLVDKGQFLFSFHVGNKTIHFDNFLDAEVDIDFCFFETKKITALLTEVGFDIIDTIERQPYIGFEHASVRAYIWSKTNHHR